MRSVFRKQTGHVTIYFEGEPVRVDAGMTVAAAVLQTGADATRHTAVKLEPRAPYCHMGVCFECLMEIDGVPNQQACMIQVREGMTVRRQTGAPDFHPEVRK